MPDENYYKPLTGFKNYELQPGDHLKFFKGLGIWTHHEPDYIEVVDENPLYIVCKWKWSNEPKPKELVPMLCKRCGGNIVNMTCECCGTRYEWR